MSVCISWGCGGWLKWCYFYLFIFSPLALHNGEQMYSLTLKSRRTVHYSIFFEVCQIKMLYLLCHRDDWLIKRSRKTDDGINCYLVESSEYLEMLSQVALVLKGAWWPSGVHKPHVDILAPQEWVGSFPWQCWHSVWWWLQWGVNTNCDLFSSTQVANGRASPTGWTLHGFCPPYILFNCLV